MGVRGFDEGLVVRRAVLGDEYVDSALASADEFSQPFQEFVTEYCWGGPWKSPVLDRKTRSMITLGILTALSKPQEIGIHVRGALNNGCTPDEIREVLLHATVYCGVPAGVDAVRAAQPVIASWTGGARASDDG